MIPPSSGVTSSCGPFFSHSYFAVSKKMRAIGLPFDCEVPAARAGTSESSEGPPDAILCVSPDEILDILITPAV
jgi:hypothetical protein